MLLWVTVLAVAGAAVALFERRLRQDTLIATLAAQAAIGLGFYAFLLFASNPFTRLVPVPVEGNGLNPLLQDPGLAFHPPTLYFGYVGISIAFSFAVGALITRDVGPAFARAMRPWVLGAWIFLTLGITAGSYWAYYELGWGGWWFWDPVENASLMPWLAATALLHSVTVLATRDGLARLDDHARRGRLLDVDDRHLPGPLGHPHQRPRLRRRSAARRLHPRPARPLYRRRAGPVRRCASRTVKEGSTFELVSREGALVVNNLLLSVILGLVFVGTLYPLVAEALRRRRSRSARLISTAPPGRSRWSWSRSWRSGRCCAGAATGCASAGRPHRHAGPDQRRGAARAGRCSRPGIGLLPLLGLDLRAGRRRRQPRALVGPQPRRTPLFIWGMVIAHLGIAVSARRHGRGKRLHPGDAGRRPARARRRSVGPFTVRFDGVEPVAGPNWTAVEARLDGAARRRRAVRAAPQARMFSSPPTADQRGGDPHAAGTASSTSRSARTDEQGRWQLRLWWKPFVTLIWFGGALVALGGLLALIGRLRRERAAARGRAARGGAGMRRA